MGMWTWAVLAAAIGCSFGVVIGGLMASAKVQDLYARTGALEEYIRLQDDVIAVLSDSLRQTVASLQTQPADSAGAKALQQAQAALGLAKRQISQSAPILSDTF